MNLRNTRTEVAGQPGNIGGQPYLHQISLIADGRIDHLRNAGQGGSKQVSHLCHNGACFNPDHLVVESEGLNKRRNTCQGAKRVRFFHIADNRNLRVDHHGNALYTEYNPCTHGREENYIHCLLPVREIRDGRRWATNGQGDFA